MALRKQLDRWVAAGLLDAAKAEELWAFEHRAARFGGPMIAGGLAAVAIGLGLISVVASNWDHLGAGVKLTADVLLGLGLGLGILRAHARQHRGARETLILIHYGWALASIALVSQVYQQGGELWQALLLWSVVTAPLMSQSVTAFSAWVWMVGLQGTLLTALVALADFSEESLALTLSMAIPVATLALGTTERLRAAVPAFAAVARRVGWLEVTLLASIVPFAFYEDINSAREIKAALPGVVIAAVLTGILWVRAPRLVDHIAEAVTPARTTLLVALVLSFVPLLPHGHGLDLLQPLCFFALWSAVAWTGLRAQRPRLVNTATGLMGARLLIAYFEVFGSLLGTGVGLVTGGLLTLGIVRVWSKHVRRRSS